ncbi:MAG: glycosyltransferase family 39 protein, partial [Acidobacteriota bacterium]|nr:glycosyltransferase family 39 protein [Acidobacteriota bacterium]
MTDQQLPSPASLDERGGDGDVPLLHRVFCWALFLAAGAAVLYAEHHWMHHRLAVGLPWMLGGILLAGLAGSLDPLRRNLVTPGGASRLRTSEKWFLVALVVGGGLVRFLSLDRYPPGGFFDEVQNLLVADGILAGNRPIFVGEMSQMPALFFYFLAAAIKIAGRSVATVRGLSAFFGTLTLPAFYFLARRAFAWPVAAATTLLLMGSRWHITFSRFGMVAIIGPLLEVLAVLFLWKAMETGKVGHYLGLGLVMGIGFQTYYSFNLFPGVLLVAVVSYAGRRGWRNFGRDLWPIAKRLVWSVLLAAVLLIPLARFALRNRETFFQRSNTVALWNPAHNRPWPGALWTNATAHLLMFHNLG